MAHTYLLLDRARLLRSFHRHYRAYFARPELLTADHAEHLAWLARALARTCRGEY